MITFQSSGPRTVYARTWSYSNSDTNSNSGGVSTGTPTSTRSSITNSGTTLGSGSGIEGSRQEIAVWGTGRQTTLRSGGTSVTASQSFSFATTILSGSAQTTRNGTVTGSTTLTPTTYTFQTPTVTTSSNTYLPDPPFTSSTTTRPTTATASATTTVSTATTTVSTTQATTAETTATVGWSLTAATVPITEIGEDTVLVGTLTSPLADLAWYPQVTATPLPCAWAYVTPSALTAPTPLTNLTTATILTTAPAVATWTTNATTATSTSGASAGGAGSSTVASTYNYIFTPASLLGSTYHLATAGPAVAVPRIPIGWQNNRSFGTFWPLGTSYTIHVATSVTDTDESLLRRAGITTARDPDGLFLVWTLNTADTLSLLGTVAVTVSVPVEPGIADPGGGYPDGTAVATVTWPPGIFDVTSVSASLGGAIASGSYRTTVTAESTATLNRAVALGVRVIPALIPTTGNYDPPATSSTNFTRLSSYNETRTGVNAHTWIDTTCQPTWPDLGDDEIDGIFD